MQGSRLYVGGLAPTTQSKDIEDIFSKHGKVREVRMNRSFAFVQYNDESSAMKAINEENGKLYFGRKIDVQYARAPRGVDNSKGPSDQDSRDRSPMRENRDRYDMSPFGRGGRGGGRGGMGRGGWGGPGGDLSDGSRDMMVGGMRGRGGMGRGGVPFRGGMQGDRQSMREGDGLPPFGHHQSDMTPFGGDFRGGPNPDSYRGGAGDGSFRQDSFRQPGVEGQFRAQSDSPFRGGIGDSPFRQSQQEPLSIRNLRHPTDPPQPLCTSNSDRVNDIEIIVLNKGITDYGEYIERKLKNMGFTVDVLFPNEEVPMGRVLGNIASRGTLYSVIVGPIHQEHRSLTLHILHGLAQEHRNMLVDDAITLISRNFDNYIIKCKEKQPKNAPPENIRHCLEQVLAGRELTGPQYEKLTQYFSQERVRVEPNPEGTATQEAELQNRILNILNKSGSGGVGAPSIPVAAPPPGPTPLLKDPSVQKALDNLIQADLLRKISNPQQSHHQPPYSHF